MKALVVHQPWAGLIAVGWKTLEVRSQRTHYRGPLVIVAGKNWAPETRRRFYELGQRITASAPEFCVGVPVALVDLVDCREGVAEDQRQTWNIDPTGMFVWQLENPRSLHCPPSIGKGRLGLIPLSDEIAATVRVAAGGHDHGK